MGTLLRDGRDLGGAAGQGYTVISTDVADHGYGTPGSMLLACRAMPGGCRSLITNPPYGDLDRTGARTGPQRPCSALCVTH